MRGEVYWTNMWKYPWVLHEDYTLLDVRKFFIILQNDCENLAFAVSRRLLKMKRLCMSWLQYLKGFRRCHAATRFVVLANW